MITHKFDRIKNSKLSGTIVAQIKQSIISGVYKPGDKLPSERELLDMFSVSRSSLREALRSLEEMGLVVIKRGSLGGAYVTRRGIRSLANILAEIIRMSDISFSELSEVRLIVEPEVARLAAQNRTDQHIEELQHENIVRERAIDEGKIPVVVTIGFHQAIARASQNKMFLLIIDAIAFIFHEEFKTISLSISDHKMILQYHKLLLNSIQKRDEEKAFALMREHIADVTKRLLA